MVQAEQWAQTHGEDKQAVLDVVEKRFQANYHQAWAASYVLDPLYLTPASSNDRWVPPFEKMSAQQRADAETVIKRLAPTDALRPQVGWQTARHLCGCIQAHTCQAVTATVLIEEHIAL